MYKRQLQEALDAQKELLEKKHFELDKFKKQQIEQLETISGMSAEQAKEKLISSLKDEAEKMCIRDRYYRHIW